MDVVQNEWQDKEYECFNDPMNMLMGWCCPLCMMCDSAKRLEESVALYCLLSYFCAPCSLCMLRKTTREKYGIEVNHNCTLLWLNKRNTNFFQGDTMNDVLCVCCCGPCVNCQVNKELKKRSPEKEGLFWTPRMMTNRITKTLFYPIFFLEVRGLVHQIHIFCFLFYSVCQWE